MPARVTAALLGVAPSLLPSFGCSATCFLWIAQPLLPPSNRRGRFKQLGLESAVHIAVQVEAMALGGDVRHAVDEQLGELYQGIDLASNGMTNAGRSLIQHTKLMKEGYEKVVTL